MKVSKGSRMAIAQHKVVILSQEGTLVTVKHCKNEDTFKMSSLPTFCVL